MSDTSNCTTKTCTRCHETKIIQEFHRMAKSPDGYRTVCKKCRAIAEGKVYIPHEPDGFKYCRHCEQMLPATDEYYQAVPNGKYGLESRCRQCKNGQCRNYHEEKRDKVLTRKHNYYLLNPQKEKAKTKKFRDNNPTYIHDWYQENKERIRPMRRVTAIKRRAAEAMADGSHTYDDLRQMYEDQGGHCAYCGIGIFWTIPNDIHVEHMMPLSRGGSNYPDNICLTCADCNLSKNDKTVSEWIAVRGW